MTKKLSFYLGLFCMGAFLLMLSYGIWKWSLSTPVAWPPFAVGVFYLTISAWKIRLDLLAKSDSTTGFIVELVGWTVAALGVWMIFWNTPVIQVAFALIWFGVIPTAARQVDDAVNETHPISRKTVSLVK